ncbi:MAG TPA: ribonuclease D, partial [Bacteroidetes bacterium]|nr:ribonuclease D [Bacteroidota bacterium]
MSIAQFKIITERKDFLELVDHLKGFDLLAVDFEGEWNLHRYGLHLCLIQVSDGEHISLIDPLTVGDLGPFLEVMEDPDIEIISHGPQSDIVLMDYLFGRQPRNVFDTEKAGQLLNYESTSLSYLLERHFGISKNMKVRVSDWNKRPLSEKMLNYAALDVQYLHQLRVILEEELREVGRFEWQLEECKALEDIRHRKKENPHLEIQRANKLSREEAHILKYIYQAREKLAQELDKPAYYIIPNSRLLELAQAPPQSAHDWSSVKGVNPRLKR